MELMKIKNILFGCDLTSTTSRQAVETAIDQSKENKSITWEKAARNISNTVSRWKNSKKSNMIDKQ